MKTMVNVEVAKAGASDIGVIEQTVGTTPLPTLIERAATALANARSAAEVLEARGMASAVYDMAKTAARLAKAKQAHDELIAAARLAQGHAVVILAQAKQRLADEYDAAQERGEVARLGTNQNDLGLPVQKTRPATVEEIGLTHKQVHEARLFRNAEIAEPGIVRRTVDEAIAKGEEPTKAKVRSAVMAAVSGNKSPEPKASDRPVQAHPCEKERRRAFADRPALNEVRKLLGDVYSLAHCLNYDDHEDIEECARVTPALFWDYLSMVREDHAAEHEEELKKAFSTLKAILKAKPKPAARE
jgi:hypothetical protein